MPTSFSYESAILRTGDLILDRGNPRSWDVRLMHRFWHLRYLHVVMLVDADHVIEARFPHKVRVRPLDEYLHNFLPSDLTILRPVATEVRRIQAGTAAREYIGRRYAWWSVLGFMLTGRFFRSRGLTCSSLVWQAYWDVGEDLFKAERNAPQRARELHQGYCTPDDLLTYGDVYQREALW